MRCMTRNKVDIYYALFSHKEEMLDDYGNKTGEYDVIYGKPIKLSANVSSAKGEMQTRQFGESDVYDKVIVLDNVDCPLDEYSILWVDTLPKIKEDGTTDTPYDYVIKRIAKSLNSISIAISKVNVNG